MNRLRLILTLLVSFCFLFLSCTPKSTPTQIPTPERAPASPTEPTPTVTEEDKETSTLSGKCLILTYYLDVSGICEKWFKGDISDEELHKIAWEFIVEIAEGKGVDPNSIDYKVKISDLTQLPPGLEHIRWDNVRDGDRQPIKEIPPACPDGHVYATTPKIKVYHPTGPASSGYTRDGSAIVRNEGNSGLMKLRIVPVDNEDMLRSLPEEEECRDNEQTIFVEANKAVYVYIVRSEVKGKLESFSCWPDAILTTYEHYGETKEMELKDETFHVQGKLTVRLVGRSASHDVFGVRIWAYPRFWKSRSWETGEDIYYLVGDYRLDGTHVKVW